MLHFCLRPKAKDLEIDLVAVLVVVLVLINFAFANILSLTCYPSKHDKANTLASKTWETGSCLPMAAWLTSVGFYVTITGKP